MATEILMPIERLLETMKEAIQEANEDDDTDMDAKSWGYQDGFLLSYNECKMLLAHIGKLTLQLK